MKRINVTEQDDYTHELTVVGWFDLAKTERFDELTEWDGNDLTSVVAGKWHHQQLHRTAGGRWVLNSWSQWEGTADVYEFVTDDKAREWLILNQRDEAVEQYFGAIEDEKGPGRPEVGPATNVRLGEELTAKVDAARGEGESRAAAIRRLLADALTV